MEGRLTRNQKKLQDLIPYSQSAQSHETSSVYSLTNLMQSQKAKVVDESDDIQFVEDNEDQSLTSEKDSIHRTEINADLNIQKVFKIQKINNNLKNKHMEAEPTASTAEVKQENAQEVKVEEPHKKLGRKETKTHIKEVCRLYMTEYGSGKTRMTEETFKIIQTKHPDILSDKSKQWFLQEMSRLRSEEKAKIFMMNNQGGDRQLRSGKAGGLKTQKTDDEITEDFVMSSLQCISDQKELSDSKFQNILEDYWSIRVKSVPQYFATLDVIAQKLLTAHKDTYVDEFLKLDEAGDDSVRLDIKIPGIDKIQCWVQAQSRHTNRTPFNNLARKIGEEIRKAFDSDTEHRISRMQKDTDNADLLMQVVINSEACGDSENFHRGLIEFAMTHHLCRKRLLVPIEEKLASFTKTATLTKHLESKTETSTLKSYYQLLVELNCLSQEQALLVVSNPMALLHDNLISKLKGEYFTTSLLTSLTLVASIGKEDPWVYLESMWNLSQIMCWVWDKILNHCKKETLPLTLIRDVFLECKPDDYDQCRKMICCDNLRHSVVKTELENASRGAIKDEDVEKAETEMSKLLTDDLKDKYQEVKILSINMAAKPGSIYKHSPYLVMYVTQCILGKEKTSYCQLFPGRGKSWIAILLAKYYEVNGKPPLIVTLKRHLVNQYKIQLNAIKEDFPVIKIDDLRGYQEEYEALIVDEFYDAFRKVKVANDHNGELPIIIDLPKKQSVTLLSAHYTREFLVQLTKLMGKFNKVCEAELRYHGPADPNCLVINCEVSQSFSDLKVKAIASLKKREDRPQIAFGFDDFSEKQLSELNFKHPFRVVKNNKQLESAQLACRGESRGIIFLGKEYRVGADIKFTEDAYVVILSDEELDGDEILQMLGRGSRANGKYYGDVFYQGNPLNKLQIQKDFNKSTVTDWEDGVQVLKLVTYFSQHYPNTHVSKQFFRDVEPDWKISLKSYYEKLSDKQKPAFMKQKKMAEGDKQQSKKK